jgi:hypothetical protein
MKYADNMNAVVSLPKDTMNCMSMMLAGVLKGATVNQYVNKSLVLSPFMVKFLKHFYLDGINKKRTSKSFSFKGNDIAWNN